MARPQLTLFRQLALFSAMARNLGPFLRSPLSREQCLKISRDGLSARAASFVAVVERVVADDKANPYARMLSHAGITPGDVREHVRRDGLEPTLEMLHDHGVYVHLDEFKGRTELRRGSLRLDVGSHDFDNPLAQRHYETRTGGSRSTGTRLFVDLDLIERDAAYVHHQLDLRFVSISDTTRTSTTTSQLHEFLQVP